MRYVKPGNALRPRPTLVLSHGAAMIVWNSDLVTLNQTDERPWASCDLPALGYSVDATDVTTSAWAAVLRMPGLVCFDSPLTPVVIARALRAEGMPTREPRALPDPRHSGRWRVMGGLAQEASPSPCSFHVNFSHARAPCLVLHSAILHTLDSEFGVERPFLEAALSSAWLARRQHRWLVEMAANSPNRHYWALVLKEVAACTITTAYLKSCGVWSLAEHAQHDRAVRDRVFAVHLCAARLAATSKPDLPPELWLLILGAVSLL